jgi:hypothetical protein
MNLWSYPHGMERPCYPDITLIKKIVARSFQAVLSYDVKDPANAAMILPFMILPKLKTK